MSAHSGKLMHFTWDIKLRRPRETSRWRVEPKLSQVKFLQFFLSAVIVLLRNTLRCEGPKATPGPLIRVPSRFTGIRGYAITPGALMDIFAALKWPTTRDDILALFRVGNASPRSR